MKRIRVGITGQSGFIGTHLTNFLNTKKETMEVVPFSPAFFRNPDDLAGFVLRCDTVVHLAAKNRGPPDDLYRENIALVSQLIEALDRAGNNPHVIFSSSTQETRDNPYGKSKIAGRKLFEDWSKRNHARFTGLIIPNVFGPFGKPFYNSAISTFAYQLTHNLPPVLETDADLDLIYVLSLARRIYDMILDVPMDPVVAVPADKTMKVSQILSKFQEFQDVYLGNHIMPCLNDAFEIALFNTFRSFIEPDLFPVVPACHADERGFFVELVKENTGGQTSYSLTYPGITRGNHYHTRKIERFCVIHGEACIRLRRIGTDKIIEYHLKGDTPAFVDIPVFYTHNIVNEGNTDLTTVFWINELFDPQDPDTYYENVNVDGK
jgi:UDP-2-acetamido-2,6-beta-L-arabino-hexul-4-ose reductase